MKQEGPSADILTDPAFDEAYLALCRYAEGRCRDSAEAEEVVSDAVLSLVQDVRAGKEIANLAGYLRVVFDRRLVDHLRRRYRRMGQVFLDDGTLFDTIPDEHDPDALPVAVREAEAVRRALARLSALYREVVYRHYMRGESVETIAAALGVPVGTVKSRLFDGRARMKGTVEAYLSSDCPSPIPHSVAGGSMNEQKTAHQNHQALQGRSHRTSDMPAPDRRPCAELSYAPKTMTVSIWGSSSSRGEPFNLISSLLAQNILILAYEKPVSLSELSATLDTAMPYVEHEVRRLLQGELLGETPGGLVYTRMFLQTHEEAFGDIPAQEALAAAIAPTVWRILEAHLALLWDDATSATCAFSQKQTATFRLFLAEQALSRLLYETPALQEETAAAVTPLPRPNGGWWLATGTVYAHGDTATHVSDEAHPYDVSGPVQTGIGDGRRDAICYDMQSSFGNAHWIYPRLPGSPSLRDVGSFFAALFNREIKPQNDRIYEHVPAFENLHILHRDESGVIHPDFPGMPFDEWRRWEAALREAISALAQELAAPLVTLRAGTVNRVPAHVDGCAHYRHASAFGCLIVATMRALCTQGLIPHVVFGETPVIFVAYRAPEPSAPA